jgi:DNA segregation ATPase FtsK/SpoIIIE-like protein
MLSTEERLLIGLKTLEKLKPNLHLSQLLRNPSGGSVTATPDNPNPGEPERKVFTAAPALETVLEQTGPLSPYTVILGACEDGLPFLLDLTNPAPGALLVTGDPGSGKTRLLRAILASAAAINPSNQVEFNILAEDITGFNALSETVHCQEILACNDLAASDVIRDLAEVVDQRRHGGQADPAILLAIDGLDGLVGELNEPTFERLLSILRHGPRSRIWTIATLASTQIDQVDEPILATFRTRLIGKVSSPRLARLVAGSPDSGAGELVNGYQFCVPFGEEWIRFWVCEKAPQEEPKEVSDESRDALV